ncbi:Reverse transcriptase, partial [Giardia duodenalis]
VRRAHELISRPGVHAVSLDTKNAFNSLPRAEVVRALNKAGVPKVLIDYIRNFLDLRHSKDVRCGAPRATRSACSSSAWPSSAS